MNKTTTSILALTAAMLLTVTGCESTLNKAAQRGDAVQVQQLLDRGENVNSRSVAWGRLPLICAARHGQTPVVEQLLNKGADVNGTDAEGWTALSVAAYRGHTECVKVLLEHGPNLNQKSFGIYFFKADGQVGKTAEQLAREQGHPEIAQLIEAAARKGNNPTTQPSVPTTLPPPAESAAPF